MTNFLSRIFGPSWLTTVSGLLGGIAIAILPILQSAVATQGAGIRVDWNNVLMGAVVAVVGYFAKAHNVSNSPTPLAVAQAVVPVEVTTPPPVLAKPAVVESAQPDVKILK
jgi:hypothetical protein